MINPRIRVAYYIAWLAFACFAVALIGPAIKVNMGAWNNPDAKFFPGWAITAIAWPYYLTNLTIIFSPLIFLLAARWRKARACFGILLILYLIPPPTLLIPGNRDSILEIGWACYLWCFAHLIAAIGASIGIKTCKL